MDTISPRDLRYTWPAPGNTFIYALVDPETMCVRYVGKSDNLYHRYYQHFRGQKNKSEDLRLWVNGLKSRGLKPLMSILEEVALDKWEEREVYWIAFYRGIGVPLLNIDAGGIRPPHTSETKAKIAAKKIGVKRGYFHRDNGRRGKHLSPETKAKLSAAMQGKPLPPGTGAKIAASLRRYHALKKLHPPDTPTL